MKTFAIWICLFIFGLISNISLGAPLKAGPSNASVSSPCTIYFAAALFSMREKSFNTAIVARLEEKYHYKVFLPQRDGFEFSELNKALAKYLSGPEILQANKLIIYSLDMGYFLTNSDVVVSILDEDLDPGVIVEISYGKLMGKYTIGIRTDVRSPYGPDSETGAHFFPLFQLDDYLFFDDEITTKKQADQAIDHISSLIAQKTEAHNRIHTCGKPNSDNLKNNPTIQDLQKATKILLGGLTEKQIHSKEGLALIVNRYLANKKTLQKLYPSVP